MASGPGVPKPRRENDPRQVHREVFDHTVVDVNGTKMARQNVSRYNEAGEFLSQGYTQMPYDQWQQQGQRRRS